MSATPPHSSPRAEDLDRLLADYFRAQVPTPWPPPPESKLTPAATPQRGDGLASSRLALAASVALIVVAGWLISSLRPVPPGNGASLHSGTATVPAELRPAGAKR